MAVVSLSTSIKPKSNCVQRSGEAGAAIAIGEVVALNSSGKLIPAEADVAASTNVVGIALTTAAAAGQPVRYAVAGQIEGATGLKPGAIYALSNTAGDLADVYSTDLTEDTSYVSIIGVAVSATTITLAICNSGVVMNLA